MVSAVETDKTMAVPMRIWDMERAIKTLPWYRFVKKWQLQDELAVMRAEAARAGFALAIKELKQMGILN